MKPIIQVRPGWVTPDSLAAMTEAGYLVIEVPDGEEIKVLSPSVSFDAISSNDMIHAALDAMASGSNTGSLDAMRKAFIKNLAEASRKAKDESR